MLSVRAIHNIRCRWGQGETAVSIAKVCGVHENTVAKVGKAYARRLVPNPDGTTYVPIEEWKRRPRYDRSGRMITPATHTDGVPNSLHKLMKEQKALREG